jgi:hypothetical protein
MPKRMRMSRKMKRGGFLGMGETAASSPAAAYNPPSTVPTQQKRSWAQFFGWNSTGGQNRRHFSSRSGGKRRTRKNRTRRHRKY